MNRLFIVKPANKYVDLAILIARIGIGLLMLSHGLPKMENLFSGEAIKFPSVFGLSPALSLGLAVFSEVFCSVLLLVGFLTRLAVVPLIITMLVAVLSIHASDPFAKQEPAIHYLLVYIVLLLTGSGKYSLDYLIQKRSLASTQNSQLKSKVFAG